MGLFRQAFDQMFGPRRPDASLVILNRKMDAHMINTSKILAGVAEINTKVGSLVALSNQQATIMKELAAQLATAIADDDPSAMEKIQKDLDTAADALHTSAEAVQGALNANTPQDETSIAEQQPVPQPAPVTSETPQA